MNQIMSKTDLWVQNVTINKIPKKFHIIKYKHKEHGGNCLIRLGSPYKDISPDNIISLCIYLWRRREERSFRGWDEELIEVCNMKEKELKSLIVLMELSK